MPVSRKIAVTKDAQGWLLEGVLLVADTPNLNGLRYDVGAIQQVQGGLDALVQSGRAFAQTDDLGGTVPVLDPRLARAAVKVTEVSLAEGVLRCKGRFLATPEGERLERAMTRGGEYGFSMINKGITHGLTVVSAEFHALTIMPLNMLGE